MVAAGRQGGFALLEVVVALAVLAAALGGVAAAVGAGLRATAQAERLLQAVTLAESRLVEAAADLERPAAGASLRRATTGTHDGQAWQVTVAPYGTAAAGLLPAEAGRARFLLIEVTVAPGPGLAPVVLRTLRPAPTAGGPAAW